MFCHAEHLSMHAALAGLETDVSQWAQQVIWHGVIRQQGSSQIIVHRSGSMKFRI